MNDLKITIPNSEVGKDKFWKPLGTSIFDNAVPESECESWAHKKMRENKFTLLQELEDLFL